MITLEFEVLPQEGGIMGSIMPRADVDIPKELLDNIQAMVARSDPTAEIRVVGNCVAFKSGLPFETAHTMAQQIKAGSLRTLDRVKVHVKCMKPQRVVVAARFDLDMPSLVEHLHGRVVL